MQDVDYTNLNTLLAYLAGPAGALAWFLIVSNFIRNWRETGGLVTWPFWGVQALVLGLSLSVPIAALAAVQNLPEATFQALQPYWALIAVVSFAYVVQQFNYLFAKSKREEG